MSDFSLMQVLATVTAAGVGGIWFRLGTLFQRLDGHEKRVDRLDERVTRLEVKQ